MDATVGAIDIVITPGISIPIIPALTVMDTIFIRHLHFLQEC